jgi:23S rRNA (adenine2030-N6)-methyltransferase
MNYRHAFHAGNFADVLKHAVLALCIERLNAKAAPWRYIDTHSGVGLYDLDGDEAARSPEWADGIARVWAKAAGADAEVQAALAPYLAALGTCNPGGKLRTYPGSPALVQEMAREGDAIRLCELHPASLGLLREAMGRDKRVKIEERDGYEALVAYVPPPERRGLVLIDPPFEEGTQDRKLDFEKMLKATRGALKRWPQGTYILWRPLKHLDQVDAFDEAVATLLVEEIGLEPEKVIVADLWVRELGEGPLAGAGVIVINPPFGVLDHVEALLPWLAKVLDQTPEGESTQAGYRLLTAQPDDDGDDEEAEDAEVEDGDDDV